MSLTHRNGYDAIRAIEGDLARHDGQALIAQAVAMGLWTQGDLARESGLNPMTITRIKQGKRATAAQRSAIYWALAKRLID